MYSHAINKLVFEFTCSSEPVAKSIEKEFVHYTASKINQLMLNVLTEQLPQDCTITISEVEIDLGDVPALDFGGDDMLNKFRSAFAESVCKFLNANSATVTTTTAIQDAIPYAELNFQVIKSLLLHGDMPWWLDKATYTDPDTAMVTLINKNPQRIKQLLEVQQGNKDVLIRLSTQYKPATKAMINQLMPGLLPAPFTIAQPEADPEKANPFLFHALARVRLVKLRSLLYQHSQTASGARKALLIKKLLKRKDLAWIKDVSFFNLFPADILEAFAELRANGTSTSRQTKEQVVKLLERLTVWEVEFMYHYASNSHEPDMHYENDAEKLQHYSSYSTGIVNAQPVVAQTINIRIEDDHSAENHLQAYKPSIPAVVLKENSHQSTGNSAKSTLTNEDHSSVLIEKNPVKGDLSSHPASGNAAAAAAVVIAEPDEAYTAVNADDTVYSDDVADTADPEIFSRVTRLKAQTLQPGNGSITNVPVPSKLHNSQGMEKGNAPADATHPTLIYSTDNHEAENDPEATQKPFDSFNAVSKAITEEHTEGSGEVTSAGNASSLIYDEVNKQKKHDKAEASFLAERNIAKSHNIHKTFLHHTKDQEQNAAPDKPGNHSQLVPVTAPADSAAVVNRPVQEHADYSPQPVHEASAYIGTNPPDVPEINLPVNTYITPEEIKATDRTGRDIDPETKQAAALPVSKAKKNTTKSKEKKQIAFIMNTLNSAHPALLDHLEQLNYKELVKLKKIFSQHALNNTGFKKLVNSVLHHPYLVKHNLLQTLASLRLPGKEGPVSSLTTPGGESLKPVPAGFKRLADKIKLSQYHLHATLKNLSARDAIIIEDMFRKQSIDSISERTVMRNLLMGLHEDAVLLLQFLTELPEAEIRQLTVSGSTAAWTSDQEESGIHLTEDENTGTRKYYIDNAGLCLIAPYLYNLFDHLKYLESRKFKNRFIACRAVFILQYLATGSKKKAEYLLQLNKLFCGFTLEEGIAANIRLTSKEIKEADSLIKSVIENWNALKHTSVQGFRESFLQRKGILFRNSMSWTLQVERKGHDILLGTIPWGYNMVKLPWMKNMLQVEW